MGGNENTCSGRRPLSGGGREGDQEAAFSSVVTTTYIPQERREERENEKRMGSEHPRRRNNAPPQGMNEMGLRPFGLARQAFLLHKPVGLPPFTRFYTL
jgi:hypothetical protein